MQKSVLSLFCIACLLTSSVFADHPQFTIRTWTASQGLPQNSVTGIIQTNDNYLWVSTFNGLARFNGREFKHFSHSDFPALLSGRLTALAAVDGGFLYGDYGGQVGLYQNGNFKRLTIDAPSYGNVVESLEVTASGGLRLTRAKTGTTIHTLDLELLSPPADKFELETDIPFHLSIIDRDESVWLGTKSQGLFRVSANGETAHLNMTNGLPADAIQALMLDHEGSLWVGTTRGLLQIKPRLFQIFSASTEQPITGLVTTVTQLANGDVLAGSRGGGLFRVENQQLIPFQIQDEGITALHTDTANRTWIGTLSGKLFVTNNFNDLRLIELPNPKSDKRIFAVFEDKNGIIWIGSTNGAFILSDDFSVSLVDSLGNSAVRAIGQDQEGAMWFASERLTKIDGEQIHRFSSADGLQSEGVWNIHVDQNNVVWSGSFGSGLNKIDGQSVGGLSAKDGLPSDIIGSIQSDRTGRVWVGSGKGVFSITGDGSIDSIGVDEGILDQEASGGYQNSSIVDQDGNLWFAGIRNLIKLNVNRLEKNLTPPSTVIEEISTDGNVLNGTRPLGAGTKSISFKFAGLSYKIPETVQYKYQLLGLDSEYSIPTFDHTIRYNNLPPGEYEFQVIAANNDGIWSTSPATASFTLLPFFWQTIWFQTLVLVFGLVLTILSVRAVYIRRLKVQALETAREKKLTDERTRIARDLHDDLGARLTHLRMLVDADSDKQSLRDRTHEMFQAMDEIVWSVDPKRDSSTDLVDYIDIYTEEFLANTEFSYQFRSNSEAAAHQLDVTRRHVVFSCYKEVLSNAVKHSGSKHFDVEIDVTNEQFTLRFTDNGKGLPRDQIANLNQSGLANLQSRMTEVSGRCELNSSENGLTVLLTLNF